MHRISDVGHASYQEGSLSAEQQALIRAVLNFGDAAVEPLVRLLSHPDKGVAALAGAALGDIPKIDPKYLPEVRAGLDRELGWLVRALGRMNDTDAAREAVFRYLKSNSAPHNQEAYAVVMCGALAIPPIVEAADCADRCGKHDHELLAQILEQMGPEKALAVPGLLNIVKRTNVPRKTAEGALLMISELGELARGIEPELLMLRTSRPELREFIDVSLIGIGSDIAGEIYAEQLRSGADLFLLRDLAETGLAGHDAGLEVSKLLKHKDWDIRIGAARTLGFIGYNKSVNALLVLLDDPADVQLHWVAIESLGRLLAKSARKRLGEIERTHWYPPVRLAAKRALSHIDTATPYVSNVNASVFQPEYFAYQWIGEDVPDCARPILGMTSESSDRKLYAEVAPEKLKTLAYKTIQLSYGPPEDAKPDPDTGITAVTIENMVEHREDLTQIPEVALRVEQGWLAGSNRGEWGGELMYIADNGAQQLITRSNIEDIYQLGDRLVATTGIAHLSINEGMIIELERSKSGVWTSTPWRRLPGAPVASGLVETGELFVKVVNGGGLLVSDKGVMRMAPCHGK